MQRRSIHFTYHPDGLPLKRPTLVGSWDSRGRFNADWPEAGRPLQAVADGSWQVTCELDCQPDQTFWWGVRDTGEWMLFGHSAIAFTPHDPEQSQQKFSMGNRHRMGVNPADDDGVRVGVWAPHAREVDLVLFDGPTEERWSLDSEDGIWTKHVESGWSDIEGRVYAFEILTSEGQKVLRADPYARRRQGPQLGVSDLFVKADGSQTHQYSQDPRGHHLLRFEALPEDGHELSGPPRLRLFEQDRPLGEKQLRARFRSSVQLQAPESWWADHLQADGSLALVRREDVEAYALCLGPAEALLGLTYTIEDEAGGTYHDRWSNLLDGHHNWSRLGVVSRPCCGVARPTPKQGPVGDLIIYEMHIGSILGRGGNLRPSRFGEVAETLSAIKDLGFTAVALMPTNPTEGHRDWGYLGTSSLAHHQTYANPGQSAEESLIEFIASAHALDLSVFTDVVYNHVGGDHNDLWNFDGIRNPWFEWSDKPAVGASIGDLPTRPAKTANALPQTEPATVKNTPWGPIPAYSKAPVFQFFVDHAVDQVQRLKFDGIRFDFTHLIHAQGQNSGGEAGWALLQEINRRLRHFYPKVKTFAEEFPPHSILTTSILEGGLGFDAMWNTEHQHRLIFSHHHLSVTQALVEGKAPPLASFLEQLLHPSGFTRPTCSATVLSNHDEVGNATRIALLVAPHPRGTDIARLVSWLSLLSPGYPILFQGTEDLAENPFTWGIPASWDVGSHLLGETLPGPRQRHVESIRDVLQFRLRRRDLHSEVPISNHYLNGRAKVLAFRRAGVWVVANMGDSAFDLPQEIRVVGEALLSSEEARYGYLGEKSDVHQVGPLALKVFAGAQD